MCLNETFVYSNKGAYPIRTKIPCKKCWQCRSLKLNDFAGRCLAEAAHSDWSVTQTLTYAPRDDLSDKVLTPRHFQNYIKRLRKNRYNVRYLVAGEYGELRGRAHFHCLLFGTGPAPAWANKERIHIPEWEHGHIFNDWSVDYKSVRYVCKYMLKHDGTESWISMSKKPPLGHAFFAEKARRQVEQGIMPRGFTYFPEGGKRTVEYYMTGATRRDYIAAVVDQWEQQHGAVNLKTLTEWMAHAVEKKAWTEFVQECEACPPELQLEKIKEWVGVDRPTERQVNKVFLDTSRPFDD